MFSNLYFFLPVGLQNINNSNEQQEAVSFTTDSWNATHATHRKTRTLKWNNVP